MQNTNKYFLHAGTRMLILKREAGDRDEVTVRIRNLSTVDLTPAILVGDSGAVPSRIIENNVTIVPRAQMVVRIPAIDSSDNLFTEQYLFLDYVEGEAGSVTDIGTVGLKVEITQDSELSEFDFYSEGVDGIDIDL